MRLIEILESVRQNKKKEPPVTRNFVAKNAQTSGAGSHTEKKFKRKEKHKKPPEE
jgi:hypothetical protein